MKVNVSDVTKIVSVVGGIVSKKPVSADYLTKLNVGIATETSRYAFSHSLEQNAKAACSAIATGGCAYAGAELGAALGTGVGFMVAGPLGVSLGYTLGIATGATSGTIGGVAISRKLKSVFEQPEIVNH